MVFYVFWCSLMFFGWFLMFFDDLWSILVVKWSWLDVAENTNLMFGDASKNTKCTVSAGRRFAICGFGIFKIWKRFGTVCILQSAENGFEPWLVHHAAKRFGTLCLSRLYRPERFGRYGHAFIYWDGLTELSARFCLDSHKLCTACTLCVRVRFMGEVAAALFG